MKKQTKVWTCRDGRKLRICDMEDTHLINTIRMLERKHEQLVENASIPMFSGEMAQYYADIEFNALMDSGVEDYVPIYENLVAEAMRRNLITE